MVTTKISIKDLVNKPSMRFLLFGGKGGVGKTTCATSTAIWIAENTDREVLILSTDPAHSLSDSLAQDVSGGEVIPIKGVNRLSALEINPKKEFMKYIELNEETDKVLATLCDTALKGLGMQAMPMVNQILSSVKEKE